jgi:hypothetical protein
LVWFSGCGIALAPAAPSLLVGLTGPLLKTAASRPKHYSDSPAASRARRCGHEVVEHDAQVVHPLDRHALDGTDDPSSGLGRDLKPLLSMQSAASSSKAIAAALLRQPGGLEGVGLVNEALYPRCLPRTKRPQMSPMRLHVDAAALSPSSGCEENQDPIPLRKDQTCRPSHRHSSQEARKVRMLGPTADRPRAAGRSGTSPAQTNSTSESKMSDVQKLPAPQPSYTALGASTFSCDITHPVSRWAASRMASAKRSG